MNSINFFDHYKTGSGKQKAWAHAITRNIIKGEDTLRGEDYQAATGLIQEVLIKCVMTEYMDRVRKCETDKLDPELFKHQVNQVLAIVENALKQKGTQAKRQALIHEVQDALVIINFRHSYSTLEWAQIAFIYLMNQRLNLNMTADQYRIRGYRA